MQLIRKQITLTMDVVLILANRQAYLAGTRFIDQDLNRLYGQITPTNTLESKRINKIQPHLLTSDYCIDFHQTVEETNTPFFIFPYQETTYFWARQILPFVPIIAVEKPSHITTSSSYMYLLNKRGMTVEIGSNGIDTNQLSQGLEIIHNALSYNPLNYSVKPSSELGPIYTSHHLEPYNGGEIVFRKNLKNFDSIHSGDIIGKLDGRDIVSQKNGKILLFPQIMFENKQAPPEGIYCLIQETTLDDLKAEKVS